MNRSLKNGCALLSVVALLAGGAWLVGSHRGDASAAVSGTSGTPSAFAWKRGTRYLYDFSWTVRSSTQVEMTGSGGGEMNAGAESALVGRLAFKSYGKQGDAWLFGVSVQELREARLHAMGNDSFETPGVVQDTFDAREAFVEVDTRGEIRRLRFHAADPALFKQLVQSVIGEAQVVLSGAAGQREWRSAESLSVGKVEMAYAVDAADPLLLRRSPVHLLAATALPRGAAQAVTAKLEGGSDIHLDGEGFVRSVAGRLDVGIGAALEHHSAFSMTFVSMTDFDAPARIELDGVAMQDVAPGAAPEAPDLRKRMDERFSTRTSTEEITRMIGSYTKGVPPQRGALNATAAFLRLHPEGCEALAAQFLDPEVTPRTREFMMGLLASAGSPSAQQVMRRALDVPETRANLGAYGRMIQRLGFVTEPSRESLDYLVALYDSPAIVADADLRRVAGLTLGAMTAHASGANKAVAESIHARLVAGIGSARTPEEKAGMVTAVGNAARASDVPLLRKVAKEGEPPVRLSVARALRGMDSPETRTALREMIGDEDADVARAAARSYDARPLTSSDMAELAALVTSGTSNGGADAAVVGLVQSHMEQKEPSEQILEAILARHPKGEASGQIRLLRRLRGEG